MGDALITRRGGLGGGSSTKSTIIVSTATGSTVGVYSDSSYTTLIKTATEKSSGEFWITELDNGTYYIRAVLGADTYDETFTISEYGVYRIDVPNDTRPVFTYTGNYELVDDTNNDISGYALWTGDWKLRLLTSGTLTFSNFKHFGKKIDVFLVGGGGGNANYANPGSGGGYTATYSDLSVDIGNPYAIIIGAGGSSSDGGVSSAFGYSANGGKRAGDGGSGGGSSRLHSSDPDIYGGTDGCSGTARSSTYSYGLGQGTTTREFGGYTISASSSVSSAKQIPLSRIPTPVEQAFLNQGYLTIEKEGVTRRGRDNVVPIVSYNPSSNVVTVESNVTVATADILRFGKLYSGAGASPRYNGATSLNTYGGYAGAEWKQAGEANTGAGGGANSTSATGGSGIVIIRNARA